MGGTDPRSISGAVIPFVLRVGVTGHRDPAEPEQAREMATSALGCLMLTMEKIVSRTRHPLSGEAMPLRIRVISSLAEGGDRIGAQAVLDAAEARSGWTGELAAAIPYDINHYRLHDCETDQSREEFDQLLSRDPSPRTLQHRSPDDDAQRDRWYREVGQHVVDRCDVLMALWDGTDNQKPAGTAATVKHALDEATPVLWIPAPRVSGQPAADPCGLDRVEPKLIMRRAYGEPPKRILRRARGKPPKLESYPVEPTQTRVVRRHLVRHFSKVRHRSDFIERLRCLERYNTYLLRSGHDLAERVEAESRLPTVQQAAAAHGRLNEQVTSWIITKRLAADDRASFYQSWFRVLDVAVYGLAVGAVTLGAVTLGAVPLGIAGWWVWALVSLEFFVLLILLVVLRADLRRKFHDRWVGFRAVAEYFRTGQFFFFVAASALRTPSDPLPLVEGTLARARIVPWFAPVVEDLWEQRPELEISDADIPWVREVLLRYWIDHQQAWHEKHSQKHERWHTGYRRAIWSVFGLSVGIVAVHLALSIYGWAALGHHPAVDKWDAVLAVAVIALASFGAGLNAIAGHANHGGHAERYREVAYQLAQQRKDVNGAQTLADLRHQMIRVRRIMLGETSYWFEGMYTSDIEVPT